MNLDFMGVPVNFQFTVGLFRVPLSLHKIENAKKLLNAIFLNAFSILQALTIPNTKKITLLII